MTYALSTAVTIVTLVAVGGLCLARLFDEQGRRDVEKQGRPDDPAPAVAVILTYLVAYLVAGGTGHLDDGDPRPRRAST